MKKGTKTLMLLPLIAICLSGCYTIIPEDAPEVSEDEFTPEGSYSVSEEDTSESSSIPYESTGGTGESTGGDSSSTPSETPGGNTSSPSETPGEGSSSSSSGSSSSTPSETHEYSYSLQINNKEDLASLTLDENDSSSNIYTLSISLISYDYDIQLSCEAASEDDVTITSSNEAAVKVDGLTLIPQVGGGETTISATWKLHSEATDSFGVIVDYIPYTPTESYEYKLVIENKDDLGSTWKITDTKQNVDHTLEVKLYEYKYLDGDLADDYTIVKDASLSDVDITFDESILGVSTDSISFYPTGVGSTDVTLTWKEHEEATDTFSVIVEEVTYEYNHTLAITNPNDFAYTDDDNVWRVGDSYKTLSVSLTSTTYTGSSDTSIESTIPGDSSNVSVSFTPEEGSPENGLTVWGLNLMANAAGTYIVTATWIGHEEATQSITVLIKEKTSESYTMSVSSDDVTNMEKAWYVEDEESRSFSINIAADDGDGADLPYSDSDIVVLHSSTELQIDSEVSGGTITITPVGITSNVTITLFVYWSLHSEAHITLTLSLNQHAYEISITNGTELSSDWSVEDGYREVKVEATKDGTTYEQNPYVELVVGSDDSDSITIDGLKITPVSEGKPTVTAVWYKYDPSDPTYADSNVVYATSESVQLSIDENIKPVSISLSSDTIAFTNAYTDSETITAVVYGKNDQEATNQSVTWSADTGIVITGEGNTIIISVTGYNVSGKVTCTSEADGNVKAECTVSIGDEPSAPAPNVDTDTKYKLGCIDASGNYVFFDGNVASSHLESTRYWDEAADVFITANPYDGIENSCTLAIFNGSSIQYITNTGSSANVTLSTSPCVWVWNEENNIFAVGSSTGYGLFCYTDDSFRGYTQSTSNLEGYPHVTAYSEQPSDYVAPEEVTIPTPNTDSDPTYKIGGSVSGTYKYFNGTISSSSMQLTTEWDSAADVYITGATGDNPDGACTLSILDSSSTLKYIQNSGSSSISLGNDPSIWYWEGEYQAFVQSTTNGRYIGFAEDGNSIKAYAHSNITGTTYLVAHAYSEDPNNAAPTSITITGKDSLYVGNTTQLSIEVNPTYANNSVIWSSSVPTVATVDQTGYVQAVAVGQTTITATSTLNESVYGSIIIDVTEAPSELTEKLLGTIDMTQNTKNTESANDVTLTNLSVCWTGNSSDFTSVSDVTRAYLGANSNSNEGNEKVLQVGSSSNTGTFTLGFSENVTKVVVYGAGYVDSSARGLTVGDQSQSFSNYISAANIGSDSDWTSYAQTLEFELDGTSQSVTIANTGKRVVLRTIDIYYLG